MSYSSRNTFPIANGRRGELLINLTESGDATISLTMNVGSSDATTSTLSIPSDMLDRVYLGVSRLRELERARLGLVPDEEDDDDDDSNY